MRRREFLGGMAFVSLAGGVPGLFARAAEESARAGANDHALVVVELTGGNDGLNTVVPFEDPLYYRNRRTLGLAKADVIRLSDHVGLHPRMKALGELFREGRVAVVQGVGYPQPDRSHFRSMEIWHTASTEALVPGPGWLGRCLDGLPPRGAEAFPRGLSLTGALPQALRADKEPVPVEAQLDAFSVSNEPAEVLRRKLSTGPGAGPGPIAGLRRQADTLYRTADRLSAAAGAYKSTVAYPDDALSQQLRRAAQVLSARLGVRVLYAAQDGYDTHSSQADTHGELLESLSNALAAFQRDLAEQKLADTVTVLVFSEFGRRVDENASRGTDHGAASCLFVVGAKVKGGLVGRYPSLETLGEGDLIFNTDFRSVYADVLERWLGCPAGPVVGQKFPALGVFS
jgi:uncharacterized protein (DUF1501 family)